MNNIGSKKRKDRLNNFTLEQLSARKKRITSISIAITEKRRTLTDPTQVKRLTELISSFNTEFKVIKRVRTKVHAQAQTKSKAKIIKSKAILSKRKAAKRKDNLRYNKHKLVNINHLSIEELEVRRKNLKGRVTFLQYKQRLARCIEDKSRLGKLINYAHANQAKVNSQTSKLLFAKAKGDGQYVCPVYRISLANGNPNRIRIPSFAPNSFKTTKDGLPGQLIGFKVLFELPFEQLYTVYINHRRLETFAKKGLKCVHPECNRVATRLIMAEDRSGGRHVDLYTDDFHHMNVDHIIPVSKGGSDHISNKQPMCAKHNARKSDKLVPY